MSQKAEILFCPAPEVTSVCLIHRSTVATYSYEQNNLGLAKRSSVDIQEVSYERASTNPQGLELPVLRLAT